MFHAPPTQKKYFFKTKNWIVIYIINCFHMFFYPFIQFNYNNDELFYMDLS